MCVKFPVKIPSWLFRKWQATLMDTFCRTRNTARCSAMHAWICMVTSQIYSAIHLHRIILITLIARYCSASNSRLWVCQRSQRLLSHSSVSSSAPTTAILYVNRSQCTLRLSTAMGRSQACMSAFQRRLGRWVSSRHDTDHPAEIRQTH